jgi:transcriptional regulator with XRE-family HTH domain
MNTNLIIARELKGWSLAKLISELGEPDYEKYELGELTITPELSIKLGELYGIDSSYFLAPERSMTNHNTGTNSHSNMIVRPEKYIDINYGSKNTETEE